MLHRLTRTTERSHDEWDIEWIRRTIRTEHRSEGQPNEETVVTYNDKGMAYQAYRTQILEKLEEGYNDGQESLSPDQFQEAVFYQYLDNQQYDLAEVWLKRHQAIEDEEYEAALLAAFIKNEAYSDAEKYILRQLQGEDSLNRVMRQIHYLAQINPLLCRFMVGNLLQQAPDSNTNAIHYYRDLSKAQSIIGMFEHLNTTLNQIDGMSAKLVYATHLLHHYHEGASQQSIALERAHELLQKINLPSEEKATHYDLLIEGAERIQQHGYAQTLRDERDELFQL